MEQITTPRMRTAPKIVAEIKALDPGSEVTEHYIRQIIKDSMVPVVWAGNKALINLDDLLSLLRLGTSGAKVHPSICKISDLINY